ncbi:MAG: hypothetical protein WD063_08575 [Pirellulales bacterium]
MRRQNELIEFLDADRAAFAANVSRVVQRGQVSERITRRAMVFDKPVAKVLHRSQVVVARRNAKWLFLSRPLFAKPGFKLGGVEAGNPMEFAAFDDFLDAAASLIDVFGTVTAGEQRLFEVFQEV